MRDNWVLVAVGLLATGSPARAAEVQWTQAALEVEHGPGAQDCVGRLSLQQAVESRLGRQVFVQRPSADVVVEARLARERGEWVADLSLRTRDGRQLGTRELRTGAGHCSALDDSLALALALMLDVPRDELPPPPPASERAARPTTPLELPRDTPAPREPWVVEPRALGVVGIGMLPGLAPGLRASLTVAPPRFWPIELDGTWWPPREAGEGAYGAEAELVTLGLYVCPLVLAGSSWLIRGCAGQHVGRVRATGHGFDRNERHAELVYAPGLRGRASLLVAGPLWLAAGLGGEVSLTRNHFVYQRADGSSGELFRAAPLAAVAELGLGLRF